MSTDTMRWLDRWLGVPLCFLLSLGSRWRHWLPSSPAALLRPRRVLCIHLAEMGSIVLAAPAVQWLQDQAAEIHFVSFERNREVLEMTGIADTDRVFLLRTGSTRLFAVDLLRFLIWAWRSRLDAAIDFEPCSRFSALLALLSGAALRSGFRHEGAYRGRLHNRPVRYRADRHMSENYLALAAVLLSDRPMPDTRPTLSVRRERACDQDRTIHDARISATLNERFCETVGADGLILLNPNAGDLLPQRRWPQERFVDLARRLLYRYPQVRVGLIGAPAEAPLVEALVAQVGSTRCASLAGSFAIAELPALFACARLLVSNDSGPAHIASLTDTPTLVLFGPETPVLYQPMGKARALYAGLPCSPCILPANQRRSACRDNRCMQAISVAEVLREAAAMLDAAPTAVPVTNRCNASAEFLRAA